MHEKLKSKFPTLGRLASYRKEEGENVFKIPARGVVVEAVGRRINFARYFQERRVVTPPRFP